MKMESRNTVHDTHNSKKRKKREKERERTDSGMILDFLVPPRIFPKASTHFCEEKSKRSLGVRMLAGE
jgi:hypothetical protein